MIRRDYRKEFRDACAAFNRAGAPHDRCTPKPGDMEARWEQDERIYDGFEEACGRLVSQHNETIPICDIETITQSKSPINVLCSILYDPMDRREAIAANIFEEHHCRAVLRDIFRYCPNQMMLDIWRDMTLQQRNAFMFPADNPYYPIPTGITISARWRVQSTVIRDMILIDTETTQAFLNESVRRNDEATVDMILKYTPTGLITIPTDDAVLAAWRHCNRYDGSAETNERIAAAIFARRKHDKNEARKALRGSILVATVRDIEPRNPQTEAIEAVARDPYLMCHIARLVLGKEAPGDPMA